MTELTVESHPIDPVPSLIPYCDPQHPLLFFRRGDGIAGIGEALRLEFSGPQRLTDAAAAWREVAASSQIRDEVRTGGSGLVAFGTFAFDDESTATSVLIVPRVVIGRRDGVGWITRVNGADDEIAPSNLGPEYRLALHPASLGPDEYRSAVAEAVSHIRGGRLSKVVLARDMTSHVPEGADLRQVLMKLALSYPDTWTFAVDGHLGSSPETLVRVHGGDVTARVLAGSHARGADADADRAAALELATSTKDIDEHRYAVESVLAALRPHGPSITATELPYALKLPNLWHLASDIDGRLGDGSGALDLVAALHPTAAVAGAPTGEAVRMIRELEPFDRGRYGGAVGWVDQGGDGKWAISLRSAEIAADGTLTAYAGAGIVAESDPDRELAETRLKFRPIVEAFG